MSDPPAGLKYTGVWSQVHGRCHSFPHRPAQALQVFAL